ncbi:DUF3047 domain-containing protein [Hydrogenophaga sp.]|uniref:DUF3047 domain-containing protein n=1 Tax=Hydrogenophaga sp. TaxID=1904254 RepID=UPI003567EE9E
MSRPPPRHSPVFAPARWGRHTVFWLVALVWLAGCAGLPTDPEHEEAQLNASGWAQANVLPVTDTQARWRHRRIANRPPSRYMPDRHAGRAALHAHSESGDSLVRLALQAENPQLGQLRFSWFVDALNPDADLRDRELDDAVVRVILQFSGDRSHFSQRDHMLSELMQLVTGEPLPYATLIYVWDHNLPVGTVLPHPRSQRIKLMVLESGEARLGQWVDFERDVAADYRHAFGLAPEGLRGIALMTDSNNTGRTSRAWYGPLHWRHAPETSALR